MNKFSEKNLVSKLDKILKREFGTNLSFQEFSAGYGIADLVFAPNFSFDNTLRSQKKAPLTNFTALKLLLILEAGKKYSFSDLQELFPFLDQKEIKQQLKVLISNEYLIKTCTDTFIKVVSDLNPIKKIIAIEVKLKDHKNGLMQARRYQYFADESYLAILKEAEKNINFDEFNKYNIGLILFDNDKGKIEIRHPKPKSIDNENPINLFARELMLSQYFKINC